MTTDPYEVLGLSPSATAEEIKKAYRKLVRGAHPDLNPDDPDAEDRFKALSAAYDLLKDPDLRARYDAGEIDGSGAERPQRQYYRDFADAPDPAYHRPRGFGAGGDPGDIFAEILRGRTQSSGGRGFGQDGFSEPVDARYALTIPFLDAARGTETRITLPDGQNLSVKIPQGTEDGQTLRLRGKGAPNPLGGKIGDALVTISVAAHPIFRREGDDILMTLPVSFDEAILGAKVTVPTIDGPVGLTIPAGARAGSVLRLRGRGVSKAKKKSQGDQKVELQIVIPKDIDDGLRDFLVEWREAHAFDPRADAMKGAGL